MIFRLLSLTLRVVLTTFCSDEPDADKDCVLTIDGRPVRHVRLDCRVALVDENRPREFMIAKTRKLDRKIIENEAPWFL
jgi:hypothetical protein